MAKKTFRKPSEIAANAKAERDAIEQKTKQNRKRLEALKAEKAEQINHYGKEIDKIRKSGKLKVEQFAEWRNAVYQLPEDERGAAIETKVAELDLDA